MNRGERRGRNAESPLMHRGRDAESPPMNRGRDAESPPMNRGDAAAATGIVRGDESPAADIPFVAPSLALSREKAAPAFERSSSLRVAPAYRYADVQGAEPCYTSVDPRFLHCLDYVFYSKLLLRPTAVLAVVDDRKKLPSRPWPSDHLPLVARFELPPAAPPKADAPAWAPRAVCAFGDQCFYHAQGRCRNYHPAPPRSALQDRNSED